MESSDLEKTQPTPLGGETQPNSLPSQPALKPEDTVAIPVGMSSNSENRPPELETMPPARSNLWRWLIVFSLVALLAIAAASAFGGYLSGIDRRTSAEATQVGQKVSEQFQLGVQDYEAKRYELARQRFEYVIKLDPDYPGVTDQLALVLLELNTTATPTAVPTPTLTPTVDLRGAEELFSQAQVLLADSKWSEAIDTLLKLRKNEPDFQPVKVDSMLFVALRNRGVQRILNEGDLEGGSYDLALAEKFGPLDVEADNYRTWADLYATGVSFWGLDWAQAVYYFGQIVALGPNLRDSSNVTAGERYRIALIKYGDFLAADKQWCEAQAQYELAFNYGTDPSVEPTASWVANKCEGGDEDNGDGEKPTEPPQETPTPDGSQPTETPPPPEPSPTPQPTEPYPTPP